MYTSIVESLIVLVLVALLYQVTAVRSLIRRELERRTQHRAVIVANLAASRAAQNDSGSPPAAPDTEEDRPTLEMFVPPTPFSDLPPMSGNPDESTDTVVIPQGEIACLLAQSDLPDLDPPSRHAIPPPPDLDTTSTRRNSYISRFLN